MSVTPIKTAKIGYIVMSSLTIILGMVFMIFPKFAMRFIGIMLGIALIIFGIVRIIGYFSKDLFRLAFQYDFAFGVLLIILGATMILKFNYLFNFLCVLLGVCTLTDGLFKIQIAIDSQKFGIKQWWLTLTVALMTVGIGLVLLFCPESGAKTITILIGLALLLEGILNLSVVITSVKIVRNQKPDVIEIEYFEKRKG